MVEGDRVVPPLITLICTRLHLSRLRDPPGLEEGGGCVWECPRCSGPCKNLSVELIPQNWEELPSSANQQKKDSFSQLWGTPFDQWPCEPERGSWPPEPKSVLLTPSGLPAETPTRGTNTVVSENWDKCCKLLSLLHINRKEPTLLSFSEILPLKEIIMHTHTHTHLNLCSWKEKVNSEVTGHEWDYFYLSIHNPTSTVACAFKANF